MKKMERGAVILSLDIEQIWGYLDVLEEDAFLRRFPGAPEMHQRMLDCLCRAGISATWFVVGGLALHGMEGARDPRMAGLPRDWTARIPAGGDPLWHRPSFVRLLRESHPAQEIGLHGGLTHLIWTADGVSRGAAACELKEGVHALEQAGVIPRSFSFPREQEVHYDLLQVHGIRCYRGRTIGLAHRLGPTLTGAALRMFDEVRGATPPPVWPVEVLRGLWNIPASMFLYPISADRTRIAGLR